MPKPTTVVLTKEDLNDIQEFFDHFDIEPPSTYVDAVNDFLSSPSLDTQDKYRTEMLKTLVVAEQQITDRVGEEFAQVVLANVKKEFAIL